MALTPEQITVLRTELASDPLNVGYVNMTDAQIVVSLNTLHSLSPKQYKSLVMNGDAVTFLLLQQSRWWSMQTNLTNCPLVVQFMKLLTLAPGTVDWASSYVTWLLGKLVEAKTLSAADVAAIKAMTTTEILQSRAQALGLGVVELADVQTAKQAAILKELFGALDPSFYPLIKSEVANDPAGLGYAGKTPGQITVLLTTPVSQNPQVFQSKSIDPDIVKQLLITRTKLEGIVNASSNDQASGHSSAYAVGNLLNLTIPTDWTDATVTGFVNGCVTAGLLSSDDAVAIRNVSRDEILKSRADVIGVGDNITIEDVTAALNS